MSLCRWLYVYAITERRLALKPFRSHRVLHCSLNFCLTWPDSIKSNVHEPYQDLGRGLGSRKTGLSPLVMLLLTVPEGGAPGMAHLKQTSTLLTIIYIVFRQLNTYMFKAQFKNVTVGGSGGIMSAARPELPFPCNSHTKFWTKISRWDER